MSSAAGAGRRVASVLGDQRLNPLERRVLLASATGLTREAMAMRPEQLLDEAVLAEYERLVAERERGQPIAYLLGEREFYGRAFKVDGRVLIPRPESELLVDLALKHVGEGPATVLDIGTGSGCLAITLKLERPDLDVRALDISSDALAVAAANADLLGATIELIEADIASEADTSLFGQRVLPGSLDLVLSNPPYIASGDAHLVMGDLRFEPKQALTDGRDGYRLINAVISFAAARLKAGAWLLLEHGYDQAETVRQRLSANGFEEVQSWRDLAGIERASGGLATAPKSTT